jgi:hypothetical protein
VRVADACMRRVLVSLSHGVLADGVRVRHALHGATHAHCRRAARRTVRGHRCRRARRGLRQRRLGRTSVSHVRTFIVRAHCPIGALCRCELDYYQPLGVAVKVAFTLLGVYERLPALPFVNLRSRALNWLAELMRVEDESTNFIDIGPVNKCMNIVAMIARYGKSSKQVRIWDLGDCCFVGLDIDVGVCRFTRISNEQVIIYGR